MIHIAQTISNLFAIIGFRLHYIGIPSYFYIETALQHATQQTSHPQWLPHHVPLSAKAKTGFGKCLGLPEEVRILRM